MQLLQSVFICFYYKSCNEESQADICQYEERNPVSTNTDGVSGAEFKDQVIELLNNV